ncbi:hypothetical protein ACWF95_40035 [Streptomyces vinaceus]
MVSAGTRKQSSGWLDRIQKGTRKKNDDRRSATLKATSARMLDIRGWRLPEGGRVESLGIDPRLYELIYESLPEGLKNRANYDLLAHELMESQLAENGRNIVGGEHVINLKGQSKTWKYRGRVRVGIFANPGQPVTETSASISQSRKTNNALTRNEKKTSGPTVNVGASTGIAARPNASAGVGYKMERESGHTRNLESERASTLNFNSGYTYFSTPAELRIEVDWNKENRALTGWARGQAHKSIVMNGEGLESSSHMEEIESFKRIFSMVPMIYGVPTALAHTMWPVHLGPPVHGPNKNKSPRWGEVFSV